MRRASVFLTVTLLCACGGGGGSSVGAPASGSSSGNPATFVIIPQGIEITGPNPVPVAVQEEGSTTFAKGQDCPAAIATDVLSTPVAANGLTTSTLTVTPVGPGTCSIVLRDGSGATQTLSVGVTITTVVSQ